MNAAGFPLLTLLTFLPLVGAAFILTLRGDEKVVAENARWTALWTSLIVFALSLILWFRFDKADAGFQFVEQLDWLSDFGITYHVGVDGISVLFILLSTAADADLHPRPPGTRCRCACGNTWSPSWCSRR